MPSASKNAAQTWIRAELVGVPDSAFGPQLMIPADAVEFHGPDLVFHRDGDVVYVTRPDQLRSLAWLGPATDPDRERRRAQWPNHGKRWTDEQRESLRGHILAGTSWSEIAEVHGRSRTGVQQEAVKQGWVDAETLRPSATLIDEGGDTSTEPEKDINGTELPGTDAIPRPEVSSPSDAPDPSEGSHRVRIRPRRHDDHAEAEPAAVETEDRTDAAPDIGDTPVPATTAPSPEPSGAPEPPTPEPPAVPSTQGPSAPSRVPSLPLRVLGSYATVTLAPRAPVTHPDEGPTGSGPAPRPGGRGSLPRFPARPPLPIPHPREPDRPSPNPRRGDLQDERLPERFPARLSVHPYEHPYERSLDGRGEHAVTDRSPAAGPLTPARPSGI